MKKTDNSVSLRDGVCKRLKQYSRLFSQSLSASLLLLTLLWQSPAFGQFNCSLGCHGAQVSLGLDCTAEVTVDMIGETSQCPNGQFTVYVYTLFGDTIPNAIVTYEQAGMTLVASVFDNITGNSCWTYITVQDKLKPTIECEDLTISCLDLINWGGPTASDNCDEDPEVILLNETAQLLCDPDYIKQITRTYKAVDESGNESSTCQMVILLERINFEDITFPDSVELACDGNWADANNDDIPDPIGYNGYPGTGVPTIDGSPIFPDFIGFCNALTTYDDVVLPQIGCVRKIMRVWTVREWHCDGETDTISVQLIEIVDNEGPSITCPANFSHTTTGHFCTAAIWMPAAIVSDNCSNPVSVTVAYPGGFSYTNGGFWANLPVGHNVITYTAYDACYNSSSCTMTIVIEDKTPPIPVCDEHTIVSLTLGGIEGLTKVDASVFDDGSYDACGPVIFRARRMIDQYCIDFDWTTEGAGIDEIPNGIVNSRDHGTTFTPKVPFSCCDAGAGPIMVELEVTDASGNVNYCMVEVEVQDKIKPHITCPSDITISCDYPLNLDDLSAFGNVVRDQHDVQEWCIYDPWNPHDLDGDGFLCGTDGLAIDNCDVDITVTNEPHIDNCGVGYIRRVWRAEDSNGFDVCYQFIYVENFHPITYESINWPDDYHGVECAEGTDPEDLPEQYSEPDINEDQCDLIGVTYEDVVFPIVDGACFKILRTWKVIEWCLYERLGGLVPGENYWEHTQIIKVVNEFGPEFLTDQPLIDRCNNFDCGGIPLELIQEAEDDCTPDDELFNSYAVDLGNDGDIDWGPWGNNGPTINATDTYPLGYHRIIYTFEDRCGNRTVREQFLDLKSCKAPVPVCINGLSTDLMAVDTDGDGEEDTGMITIWASDFDASSYHPCGFPFYLSLAPDINVTSRTFTCEDVGAPVPVNLYVTDDLGNQAYCETYIIVQDNMNLCDDNGNLTGTITGNVSTETSDNVLDVEVKLTGSAMLPINTNQAGMYSFPSMPAGGSYTVSPAKNNDYKNGVSTLDLVYIQKHLLGIKDLDSPYKIIAADANNSESITAIDLIEFRKLVLGIYAELPNNASWRFVDKGYSFPDPYNPWMQDWPEFHSLTPLAQGVNHADFFGIKIGDVNNTVKANATSIVPRGSGKVFDLAIDDRIVAAGETFEMPVYAAEVNAIEGVQFSFDMGAGLQLAGVRAGTMDVTEDNFGWLQNRTLTSSWNSANGISVDATQPLFTLIVEARESVKLSESISLVIHPTYPEAYTIDSEVMDIGLTFRGSEDQLAFELLQNEPNPFTHSTQIGFVLPQNGEATLTLFDVAGKQLFTQTVNGVKGMNRIELSKDQIGTQGMIYYQVQFQGYTATKKMLML